MATVLETLLIELKADPAALTQLKGTLNSAVAESTKAAQTIEKRFAAAGKSLTDFGKSASLHVTAPLMAISAAAIAGVVQIGNYADRLMDLADQTGLTTDQLQSFERVAIEAGVSTDTLAGAAKGLRERLAQTAGATSPFNVAMTQLGVSSRDATGQLRPMSELLPEIVTRLSAVTNEQQRNILAVQTLGPAYADQLIPVLALGSTRFNEITAAALASGEVLGTDALEAANAARIEFESLTRELGLAGREIQTALLPAFTEIVGVLRSDVLPALTTVAHAVADLVGWFGDLNEQQQMLVLAGVGIVAAVGPVAAVLGTVATAIGKVSAAMAILKPKLLLLAGPAGIIAAVALGLYGLWSAMDAGAPAREANQTSFEQIVGTMQEYRDELRITNEAERELALARLERQQQMLEQTILMKAATVAQIETELQGRETGTVWDWFQLGARQVDRQAIAQLHTQIADLWLVLAEVKRLREQVRVGAIITPLPLLPHTPRTPGVTPAVATATAEAEEIVGIIGRAEAELAALRESYRAADNEADLVFWGRKVAAAEAGLERLRRLHEVQLPAFQVRVPQGPIPELPGIAPPIMTPELPALRPPRHVPLGVEPVVELLRLIPIPDVKAGIDDYLRELAQLRQRAITAGIPSLIPDIAVGADVNALANAIRTIDSLNAATERGAAAAAIRAEEERQLAMALEQRDRILSSLAEVTERGAAEAAERAHAAIIEYATALDRLRQAGTDAAIAQRQVSLAIEPVAELTNENTRAARELAETKLRLGMITSGELLAALQAEELALQNLLGTLDQGSAEWRQYGEELVAVQGKIRALDDGQQKLLDNIQGMTRVGTAAADALGLGLGGAVSALESMVTSIITKDIFGAVASGINLLSELFGGLTDGVAEVDRQIRELADGSRLLSETLIRELAVTTRVQQDNIWGWLFGATTLALDEQATREALAIGTSIAEAIASGIRDGGEALQQAIDDILLQAAIESAIMDQTVQALIGAWVAAFQAGDTAELERLRQKLDRIVSGIREDLIDTGLIEETAPGAPGTRPGGVQISEITGPTRDLFADLMSPLVELPVHTMLLGQIRDLLRVPRTAAGAGVGNLTVNITGGDPIAIGKQVIEMIERKFYIQRRGAGR